MTTQPFNTTFSSPIEDQIQRELNNYRQALKTEDEFYVLRSITDKIKMLEELLKQRQRSFRIHSHS